MLIILTKKMVRFGCSLKSYNCFNRKDRAQDLLLFDLISFHKSRPKKVYYFYLF